MTEIKIEYSGGALLLSDSDKKRFGTDFTNAVKAEMEEIKENYGENRFEFVPYLVGKLKFKVKLSHMHAIHLDVIDETEFCWMNVSVLGWDSV